MHRQIASQGIIGQTKVPPIDIRCPSEAGTVPPSRIVLARIDIDITSSAHS